MQKHFCDVCGCEASLNSLAVVKVMYKLMMANNRSRSYGGSRGSVDLCEECRLMAINNKIGEVIANQVINQLREIRRK